MKSAELIKEINSKIKDLAKETDALQKSAQFQEYLDTMAKFWEYSFRNQILIHNRMPEASRVAGFRTWKNLGRFVKQGEKAIKIIAPFTTKDPEGKEETYFFPVNVFDISQTQGEDLPNIDIQLEGNSYQWMLDKLLEICKNKQIKVEFANLGVNDLYGYASGGKICISKKDSVNTQVNTLVHELAHELLHFPKEKLSEKFREIQAEGVSYVVCKHFGLETKSYMYLGLKKANSKEIMHNLEVIARTSREIIEKLASP